MAAAAAPTAMPAFTAGERLMLLETVVAIVPDSIEEFVLDIVVALLEGGEVVEISHVDGVEVPATVRIIAAGFVAVEDDIPEVEIESVLWDDLAEDDVFEDDVVEVVSFKSTRAD